MTEEDISDKSAQDENSSSNDPDEEPQEDEPKKEKKKAKKKEKKPEKKPEKKEEEPKKKNDSEESIENRIKGALEKGHNYMRAIENKEYNLSDDTKRKYHAESEKNFKIAAELNPNRNDIGWTYQWIARECIHQDNSNEAIKYVKKAQETLKHTSHDHLQEEIDWTRNEIINKQRFWGECNRNNGDRLPNQDKKRKEFYAEAEKNYRTAAELDPARDDICSTYQWIARACIHQDKADEAIEYVKKAEEALKNNYNLDLKKEIDWTRNEIINKLFFWGECKMKEGNKLPNQDKKKKENYAEAEKNYRKIIEFDPQRDNICWAYQLIAKACIHQDKADEAIKYVKKAEETERHMHDAELRKETGWTRNEIINKLFFWGELNRNRKNHAEAEKNYKAITEFEPDRKNIGWLYYWIGVSCIEQGKDVEARGCLQKAQKTPEYAHDLNLQKEVNAAVKRLW